MLAARPAPAVQSDLDDFMKQVLANRDENWKKMQQYILEEREAVEVRGPSHVPVWGDRREYSWFIRDGYFIRSPVKANGVTIGEADRQKAEDSYLKRVKAQDKKQREKDEAKGEQTDTTATAEKPVEAPVADVSPPTDINSLLTQSRQPEFIDSAYFLRFKFEQGKYAFVGRETLDGRDVLRIEYYPSQLFTHEQDAQKQRDQEKKPNGEDVEAAMEPHDEQGLAHHVVSSRRRTRSSAHVELSSISARRVDLEGVDDEPAVSRRGLRTTWTFRRDAVGGFTSGHLDTTTTARLRRAGFIIRTPGQ